MGKALLEKIILEETKNLSQETLDEILDFIKFKKMNAQEKRSFAKKINQELSDLSEVSLAHLEEEFSDYKERYLVKSKNVVDKMAVAFRIRFRRLLERMKIEDLALDEITSEVELVRTQRYNAKRKA
jgi:hypothetical protein